MKSELLIPITVYFFTATASVNSQSSELMTPTPGSGNICGETINVENSDGQVLSISLENNHNWAYAGVIEIGNPPQKVRIEFDTGSAVLWVISSVMCEKDATSCAGHHFYNHSESATYIEDGRIATLQYGTGISKGFISEDEVVINGIKIGQQKFLEVTSKKVFYDNKKYPDRKDGVLGLGFPDLSQLRDITKSPVPLCTLFSQGFMKRPIFAFYHNKVEPSSEIVKLTGELVLGGVNPAHYSGEITYASVSEGAMDWIISVDRVLLNEDEIGKEVLTMIDSGTSAIIGPNEIVSPIKRAVFGDNYEDVKRNTVECSIISSGSLPDVTFVIKGVKFVLTPEDYIVKEYSNTKCLCGFTEDSSGLLVMGNVFMRKVYTVFDVGNMQIGFALAKS